MTTLTNRWANNGMADIGDRDWQSLRVHLESLAASIREQIREYPPPIPACDAQFNHLLELRATLPRELSRLERAFADPSMTIEKFVESSGCKEVLTTYLYDSE